ncbi:unnamed protein product [Rhizophagus irregularis]|uniref:HAT C-terminal dimerisation domain-containing protein n=1 Tax=Rhizophagus irregularis TaxID=588596 RepID=A0A915ZCR0_9GLOM|nr:unnamed protein product [Rhizophagus irregularis]
MARDYLAIPATSTPIEKAFSGGDKDHYKEFNTIYGTQTSDKYRLSCMAQPEASDMPKDIVVKNDQLCYYCELKEFLIDIDDDILENYQSVYPLCSNCKIGGRKIHTWGKKKIPGISNKRQKLN